MQNRILLFCTRLIYDINKYAKKQTMYALINTPVIWEHSKNAENKRWDSFLYLISTSTLIFSACFMTA